MRRQLELAWKNRWMFIWSAEFVAGALLLGLAAGAVYGVVTCPRG